MEETQTLLQSNTPYIPYDSQMSKNIAKTYLNVFSPVLDFSSISEVNIFASTSKHNATTQLTNGLTNRQTYGQQRDGQTLVQTQQNRILDTRCGYW